MTLSTKQIIEFYEVGYFVLEGLFSQPEIAEMKQAMERLQNLAQDFDGEAMKNGSKFVVQHGLLERVVWAGAAEQVLLKYGRDTRLTSVAAQILGSNYANHLINQAHFKLPGGGFYRWHQDSTHRGYGTENWTDVNGRGSYVQSVTAVDEATMENGPLMLIPATKYERGHLDLPYDKTNQTISDKFNPKDAVPLLMKPGDAALFGPYTIHGSFVNNSASSRRIFINGYAYPGANRKTYPGDGAGELIKLR